MLFALSNSKNNLSHKLQWFSLGNVRFSLPTQDIGKTEAHMKRMTFTAHSHKNTID